MAKSKHHVEWQKLAEKSGDSQSYEKWVSLQGPNEDQRTEQPQANPDELPESENTAPTTPQLLMGEAIEHLQGRQKETYFLTMREGKSLSEVGQILGISKSAAQIYKLRAIKFIELYCREAIKKGRV